MQLFEGKDFGRFEKQLFIGLHPCYHNLNALGAIPELCQHNVLCKPEIVRIFPHFFHVFG